MKKNIKVFVIVLIIFVVLLGLFLISQNKTNLVGNDRDAHGCIASAGYSWCGARNECLRSWEDLCTSTVPKTVTFNCDEGKNVVASFYLGGENVVDLKLNDGRKISLPLAMSASGARYAKPDESFVFWNKGDTAFITEGDPNTPTFKNCMLVSE